MSEIRKKNGFLIHILDCQGKKTYDLNIEVVKKWIKSDQYFDPKRFLKLWKIILMLQSFV